MGIQGLLPLLKPIHKEVNLSKFAGQTIGVDTYCWLHKGAYGCAMDIVEGKNTRVYLNYVLKRIDMMLYHDIKPYLVLDGGHLPSKANKEAERRKSRQDYKAKGLAFLRAGNKSQAFECFQKCVDITPEMALEVIKACRERNIDYVVAPYEADSQLAYLMKTGITQATISEDSDLLVYGCNKVIFKMDEFGTGTLVDLADLPKLKNLNMHEFTLEKFRHMCILSGCDYLPSIKGIGLKTANKLIRKHPTIEKLVRSVRMENKLKVPVDYEKNFKQADETFLYQLVFDPNKLSLVPLTPLPDGVFPGQLDFAGPLLPNDIALAIALGNINPITNRVMDDYDPTNTQVEKPDESKAEKPACAFTFTGRQSLTPSTLMNNVQNHSSNGEDTRPTTVDKCRRFLLPPLNRPTKQKEDTSDDGDIMKMYTFLKQKSSTTQGKQNRMSSLGSGLSRKQRIKNPFRLNSDNRGTGQPSSYFTSTNATHLENEETADSTNRIDFDENKNEKAIIPDMPSLPTWNDSEKQSTFEEEKQNENSPTDSASMNFPTLASRPGKILSNALDITDRTSELTFEDDKKPSDYNGSSSSVTKKPRKVLKLQNGSKTAPLSTAGTPLSGLNKFIYKPSCKNNPKDDKEIISVVDSQEVIDSGYLSDGEESTDTDTPLRRKESHKIVSRPISRPIQLKSGPAKRSGLGRCKSLGISKRKCTSTSKAAVTGNSTLFSYFEYKNKRTRLDTS